MDKAKQNASPGVKSFMLVRNVSCHVLSSLELRY